MFRSPSGCRHRANLPSRERWAERDRLGVTQARARHGERGWSRAVVPSRNEVAGMRVQAIFRAKARARWAA